MIGIKEGIMKIQAKLLVGFISVALLCAVVGFVGIGQINRLDKSITQISEETIPTLNYLKTVFIEFTNVKVAIRSLANPLGIDDDVFYQRQLTNIENARVAYKDAMAKFEALNMVPEEAKQWAVVKSMIAGAATFNNDVLAKAAKARVVDAKQRAILFQDIYVMISGEQRLVMDNLLAELKKLIEFDNQYYGIDIPKKAIAAAVLGNAILLAVTITAFAVAAILGLLLGSAISRSLKKAVRVLDKIAVGDLSEHMEVKSRDEFQQVAASLNSVATNVANLVADAGMLVQAALDGKLSTRADASKHQGDYRKIVDGVNKTLDAVIGPLNVAANYVDRISKGDLPPKITDSYNGDFNEIKNNLNTAIGSINALVADAAMLSQAALDGKLATRADASRHQGDYRKIVDGVNKTLDAVIGPLNVTARYVDDISKGVIPPVITDNYNGDFNVIKNNLNAVVKMMSDLLKETDIIIRAAADGELDKRADAGLFLGGWKQLVTGVNDTITNIVDPLMVTADYVDKVSKGVIPPEITTVYKGQYNIIKNNLNMVVKMMSELLAETDKLVKAALIGQLSTRADAEKFLGGWNKLVSGVNETLGTVITPINETVAILRRLAEGDLTMRMTGDYKGDFDILKTALNDSLDSFNDTLRQVNIAVDQVAEGSLQVSQASQSLSQGATEQASSLEEITSSVTEIAGQTKLNTENAGQVNSLANTAKGNAEQGNVQMQNLVIAMGDINKSAEEIKKIVKAIDDIAFQINLLALNANVEAARAGKYGKGFAVVAEEVRNLAVRSANSVKDTTRMVEEAISNIGRGNSLCDLTAKQLREIVGGAGQVATLAEEVATASKEQTQGLEQITTGLNQIDQVTQANTAASEESASASEELSSQSQQVKNMLSRFRLKETESKLNNSEVLQMLRSEMARQGVAQRGGMGIPKAIPGSTARKGKPTGITPADVISLDDENFGKF